MSKTSTKSTDADEKQLVYVPALGHSIEAVDQADVEKQVEKALKAQEEGDGNS